MSAGSDGLVATEKTMGRRVFLAGGLLAGLGLVVRYSGGRRMSSALSAAAPKTVTLAIFSDDGRLLRTESLPTVVKTEAEWQKALSPASFEITRHAGTENPFTGGLLNEHGKGVFRCICCDTAVFDSATKFESGTGWPSFYQPIAKENVIETTDTSYGMARTAVSCTRCEAHLGHVFDDGPPPTGLRYCMNSVALRFAKAPVKPA